MKIVQITPVVEGVDTVATIYGLGDDNNMYYWGYIDYPKPGESKRGWKLYKR